MKKGEKSVKMLHRSKTYSWRKKFSSYFWGARTEFWVHWLVLHHTGPLQRRITLVSPQNYGNALQVNFTLLRIIVLSENTEQFCSYWALFKGYTNHLAHTSIKILHK